MKKWVLYFLYFIAVTIGFLYYMFPSATVARLIEAEVEKNDPDLKLEIQSLKPAFPPGITLSTVDVLFRSTPVFGSDRVRITPQYFSILRLKPKLGFKSETYGGIIEGTAEIRKGDKPEFKNIDAEIRGLRIEGLPVWKKIPEVNIAGILGGTVTFANDETESIAGAKLEVGDVRFSIGLPFFNLAELTFETIQADLAVNSQKKMEIRQCALKGKEMDGTITGSMLLKKQMDKSVLNIRGNLVPHPEFEQRIKKGMLAYAFPKKRGKGYNFRLTGTVEHPRFSWN